jgi:hypothetical protein
VKSARRGGRTSKAEVTNVSRLGFWLLLDDRELSAPFAAFPWFRDASIGQILAVERPSPRHLYWPHLDVDLAEESIDYPERYPLVSNAPQARPVRHTEALAVRERAAAYRAARPQRRARERKPWARA